MFSKLKKTLELMRECKSVLRKDASLFLFPVLSMIVSFLVMISFFLPISMGILDSNGLSFSDFTSSSENTDMTEESGIKVDPLYQLVILLYYFVSFFIIIYFNVAFSGATLMVLRGQQVTVMDGLRCANKHIHNILIYSIVAASVGWLIKFIEQRSNLAGKVVMWILGAAWTLMTYFVAPILAEETLGIKETLVKSKDIFTKTWGENAFGSISFGLIQFFYIFAIVLGTILFVFQTGMVWGIAVALFLLMGNIIYFSTISGVFRTVLYLYALNNKQAPEGFDPMLIEKSFSAKQ